MRKKLLIQGMSCMHCVKHVEDALKGVEGVSDVKVDLKGKNALVDTDGGVTDAQLRSAVEDAGYDVVGIENL